VPGLWNTIRPAADASDARLFYYRDGTGDPARLVVVTVGGYAYERDDGVAVVPITALGP